jgi:hypothetical protein
LEANIGWLDKSMIQHPHMLWHACGFALANKGHDTRALQAYLERRSRSPVRVVKTGGGFQATRESCRK